MPTPKPHDLPAGFSLVRPLSLGERSHVLEARGADDEHLVVRVLSDPEARWGLEAEVASRVACEGLCAPVAWGRLDDGRSWIARPFIAGRPLDEALREADEADAARWIASLLRALQALHDAGLVHRDLKADNVLVDERGPWLVDLDLLHTHGGPAAGSPQHLAPELMAGHLNSASSDLFALGATLAFAWCGAPRDATAQRFPAIDFWTATGLDPARIPGRFARLVRALVRRHPNDRPAQASAAAALLDVAGLLSAPPLQPPFLLGRQDAYDRVLAELSGADGASRVLLMEVAAEDEAAPLTELLSLGLAAAGIPREATPTANYARACRVDAINDPDVRAAELAESLTLRRGPARVLVGTRAQADAIVSALRHRRMDAEVAELGRESWPALDVASLVQHLNSVTEDSNPELTRQLAAALVSATGGSQPRVARQLARAESLGVLRADDARWTVLRGDWPASDESPLDLGSLSAPARELLLALAVLADDPVPTYAAALRLADLDLAAGRAARDELGARDLVETGPAPHARRARQVLAALPDDERRTWHGRALTLLEPALPEVRCRHLIGQAGHEPEQLAALELWDGAFAEGRFTRLRALLEFAANQPVAGDDTRRACALRVARLELAQGHAERAWQAVADASAGPAANELLLVAAHAAEQSGRRAEARELNTRVLASDDDRAEFLRAQAGLALADLLDGNPADALARTDDIRDDDELAAAALALSMRGVALLHLDRQPEAGETLDAAHARAQRSGQPTLVARTQLNRAQFLRRAGSPAEAVVALQDAERAFARASHVHGRAQAAHSLGVLQRDLGELASAREQLTGALGLFRRAGDTHGAATSLASLAAVELEAGHVGVALELAERAGSDLEAGGHRGELGFAQVHVAMASALEGRHERAATCLARPEVEALCEARPGLVNRARAWVQALAGDEPRAVARLRQSLGETRDAAERFRLAALLAALDRADELARTTLTESAATLASGARRDEALWRTSPPRDPDSLQRLLDSFDGSGRTDLTRSVARCLADAHDAADRVDARRAASARAARATDALVDGLPALHHERVLQRLARFAGGEHDPAEGGVTLDWLLACNRRLAREEDLDALLLAIVDAALDVTHARRGFLVLLDGDDVHAHVARGMEHHDLEPEAARFSQSVVQEALRGGRPVLTSDATADTRFSSAASIAALSLRSVLCVPLPGPDINLGALYVDDDSRRQAFDDRDVERVVALADQAATTVVHVRRRAEVEALNARLADRVEHQAEELDRARRALRRRGEVAPVGGLVGESAAMQKLYALIDRIAPTDLSVLVTGPSGSGKDVVSRALHERSDRAAGPLVIENVAAVPATLLESELFGHARGAFTGADRDRPGLFAEADGGTFVLDEIGELPLELQPKLLRVLETGEVRAVGAQRARKVDVRIVAATNRDLLERVRDGSFREDLYYRLNGVELALPPLEQRLDDIPLLVTHFLDRLIEKHGTPKTLSDVVLAALVGRPWPGQVRELSNEVARLYHLSEARIEDTSLVRSPPRTSNDAAASASLRLEDVERDAITRALAASGGRKDRAAQLLGISRTGLYAKLKRLGIATD